MSVETAPYMPPPEQTDILVYVDNFDMEKIETFNNRIMICGSCVNVVDSGGIPTCSILVKPVSSEITCPMGKW